MGDIIYDREKFKQGWKGGLPETPCGSGSRLEETKAQRAAIPNWITKYGIKTIADIGAGDLNWITKTDLRGATYTPFDLVPRKPEVQQFDIVEQVPGCYDLIICLWVLNHLPFDACRQALQNIKASGSGYLLMTDRPIWHHEQPPEIVMGHVEELVLNKKGDRIILCPI